MNSKLCYQFILPGFLIFFTNTSESQISSTNAKIVEKKLKGPFCKITFVPFVQNKCLGRQKEILYRVFHKVVPTITERISEINKKNFLNTFLILRQIYGPKRTLNGEWRRRHNEELHSLYYPPNIVRVIKCRRLRGAGHVARMEKGRSAFKILTDTPTGKRSLEIPRHRWEDNIRIHFK